MPVDFNKLRTAKKQPAAIDPIEIFRRLPKSARIKDLYGSQAEVLSAWFAARTNRDHVLKLHTGGGKTLVGLLIAQSTLNELAEPVLFVCPNNQLVDQTMDKAAEYSIPACRYETGQALPNDFQNAKAILVATYKALFHGFSKFGLRGKDSLKLGGIIVDDAHAGFGVVRDSFTLRVKRSDDPEDEAYANLTVVFRQAFKEYGQLGTFDDVISNADYSILEVPYWAWQEKLDEIQPLLRKHATGRFEYEWPLLRDNLRYCHCLITKDAFDRGRDTSCLVPPAQTRTCAH